MDQDADANSSDSMPNPTKRLELRGGSLVVISDEPLPAMPLEIVRDVLESIRR